MIEAGLAGKGLAFIASPRQATHKGSPRSRRLELSDGVVRWFRSFNLLLRHPVVALIH